LCSCARFAPGVKESAGQNKGRGTTGHGNPYLPRVLGEAAVAAGKTDTFLGERYRRIARRRGKKKGSTAVSVGSLDQPAAGAVTWEKRPRRLRSAPGHHPRKQQKSQKKAIVAVGRSILVIIWHLLSDPEARYHDLGSDFYDNRIGPDRKTRNHVRQLESLGFKVTLEPAA